MKETILICGGSGMIGQAVAVHLIEQGYQVQILTRKKNNRLAGDQFLWNPYENFIEPGALDQIYGVIQLSGESIAKKRWSSPRKQILKDSRILTTRFLVNHINALIDKPKVFISTSAIGIYGDRPNETLTESSSESNQSFLASLCKQWEAEMLRLHPDIRNVIVRIGLVLSLKDGLLAQSVLPARWGLAPIFGPGKQIYSWVHIHDLAKIFQFLIENKNASGVFNGTAPHPVTQDQFVSTLSKVMHRPAVRVVIPEFLLKIVLGELANVLYESQLVLPEKLSQRKFEFKYPTLESALKTFININK